MCYQTQINTSYEKQIFIYLNIFVPNMTKDKTFFVNLKEDTKMLRIKLNWILDELESRIIKANETSESHILKAISRPMKTEMRKNEVIENAKRWYENTNLKVHMCLSYLKRDGWEVDKSKFFEYCKKTLNVKRPDLFLLSLTKKPYIREWTNIEDQKRKARDYGDVLQLKNLIIKLNPLYENEIKKIWEGSKK